MVLWGKIGGGLAVLAVLAALTASAATPLGFEGTDSERIEQAIAAAVRDGSRSVTIPKKADGSAWMIERAILVPGDFTLEIDDALVQLKPGTRDNLIRNASAVGQCQVTPSRNIVICGKGRAVLCGGTGNHYAPNRSGDVNGWPTIGILLAGVDTFRIEGLTLKETQAWGVSVENGCVNGVIRNLVFDDSNLMRNQDGVDIRKGCHDIVIENISGVAGDDVVALTALRSATQPEGRLTMQIGGNTPTDHDDVYNVTISNVHARCSGGHGVIRLLCQDGIKMHDIRVLDVVDTTDVAKGEPRASAVIRLGDTNYSSIRRADLGDMHDIFVDGVTCRAKCGVRISGPLSDTVIRDVTVPADARKYDITAPTQKVVTE